MRRHFDADALSGERGGIGIRSGLKIRRLRSCGFESRRSYQLNLTKGERSLLDHSPFLFPYAACPKLAETSLIAVLFLGKLLEASRRKGHAATDG